MLIIGDKIVDDELVLEADKRHIKNASYYLTIGSIIPAGEAARKFDPENPDKTLVMEPRQIAWVVSREVFNIESYDVTAIVTLRSTMTKKGLLALDVGLVDPGYKGPIGSVVINFSKDRITLNQGDEFFRVVFFNHEEIHPEYRAPLPQYKSIDYIKQRHSEIVKDFPETFMDAKDVTKEIYDDILDNIIGYIFRNHWGKIIAGMFVLVSIVIGVIIGIYLWIGQDLSQEKILEFLKKNKEIIEIIKNS